METHAHRGAKAWTEGGHRSALDRLPIEQSGRAIPDLDHMHRGLERARKSGVPADRVLNAMTSLSDILGIFSTNGVPCASDLVNWNTARGRRLFRNSCDPSLQVPEFHESRRSRS